MTSNPFSQSTFLPDTAFFSPDTLSAAQADVPPPKNASGFPKAFSAY